MALRHKIKPHHHVSIWLSVALLFVASVVAYNSATIGVLRAQDGPSAATKKFFGFNDDNGQGQKWVEPAVCQQNSVQTQMQALQSQMQQLQQQEQQLMQQMQQSQPQPQDQTQAQQQQTQVQQEQQQEQSLQTQMSSLQQQMKTLQSQMQQGPSDDCKKAIVAQAVSQMQAQQAKMFSENKLTSTLDKVDAVIAKVQTDLPGLQAAGVSTGDLNAIKTDITAIQQDNATLRSFFNQMKTQMATFISQAQSDPLSTFDKMQHGSGPMSSSDSNTAANAADGMVSSFTSLTNTLDKITNTTGTQ